MKTLGVFLIHLSVTVAVIFGWFTIARAQEAPAWSCDPPRVFADGGSTLDATDGRIRWCVPWFMEPPGGTPVLAPRSDEPGGWPIGCYLSVEGGSPVKYTGSEPGDVAVSVLMPDRFGQANYCVSCNDDGGSPLCAVATFPDAPVPVRHPLGVPGVPVRGFPGVEDGDLLGQPGDEGPVSVDDD